MRIPIAELVAAGLYEPAAAGAADRLALLEWLVDHGATLDHMVRAARAGHLIDVAADLARQRGRRMTLAEIAARTAVSPERVAAIRFAAGLPALAPDEAVLTEADVRTLEAFAEGERLFGADAIRRFMQVIGGSLARIAEAAISIFLVNLEAPLMGTGATEVERAEARFRAAATSQPLSEALAQLFLSHMDAANRRLRRAQMAGTPDLAHRTVGFVDLVGFTTLARRVEPRALAPIIERFEETAHDVAAAHGGRVVKFVGDEVMFVTEAAATACDIALTLVERFAGDMSVTPRGGLAAGEVLVRGGDYYGTIVNLAARMAEVAVPREILVTEAAGAEAASGGFRLEPAGRRSLKGFDEPVRLFTVERAA